MKGASLSRPKHVSRIWVRVSLCTLKMISNPASSCPWFRSHHPWHMPQSWKGRSCPPESEGAPLCQVLLTTQERDSLEFMGTLVDIAANAMQSLAACWWKNTDANHTSIHYTVSVILSTTSLPCPKDNARAAAKSSSAMIQRGSASTLHIVTCNAVVAQSLTM